MKEEKEEEGEEVVVQGTTSPPPIFHAVTKEEEEEEAPPTTARAEAMSAGESVTGYPPSGGPKGGKRGDVEEEGNKEGLLAGTSVTLGVIRDTKDAIGLAPKPLQLTATPNTPPTPVPVEEELKRHLRV